MGHSPRENGGVEPSLLALLARDLPAPARFPILAFGLISLLLGLAAGLVRLGWPLPLPADTLIVLHGPLMVSGFFGTVIGLERAVALGQRWAYVGPVLTGAGGLLLIAGGPVSFGAFSMALGSFGLAMASLLVWLRQRALFTATLFLGALSWLVGNLLWLYGWGVLELVPWWAGFLVLTIAGERLELSRMLPPSRAGQRLFGALLVLLLSGQLLSHLWPVAGQYLLAVALLALTLWLWRYDIARRTVRSQGLTRFIAIALLSAYAWLAVGAVIGLLGSGMFAPQQYDATLHALFLGFVFSMVFGHAPIIFPAVTRLAVPYTPLFYLPLILLHISLALRLGGDLGGFYELRRWGALLNGATLILFLLNTITAIVRGRLHGRRP